MNAIVPVDQDRPRPALVAGNRPAAIVPRSMDEAFRLANAVCVAGLAPKGLDTPEKAMVAIMHGLEIGLTPMAALQRIAVVNGRPSLWGDGAMGLVRASGLCEFVRERVEGDGDKRVAICEAKRRGESEAIIGRFSVADARRAGLWDKAGPWKQYPDRMLQMRARAFALRDGFADVLGGLHLTEELQDGPAEADRPASSGPRRAPPPPPPQIAAPAPPKAPEPPAPPPPADDADKLLDEMATTMAAGTEEDHVHETWNMLEESVYRLPLPAQQRAREIYDAQLARFEQAEAS
jgi:hypothetical protein